MRFAAASFLAAIAAAQPSHARDVDGRYAQADPELRKWFEDQKVPGTNSPCCSAADGITAEEDIRGNDYWVRFEVTLNEQRIVVPWMKVPPEAVLATSNMRGVPVVWWTLDQNNQIAIRCYSAGPKS